jgi:maleylacetate reductase
MKSLGAPVALKDIGMPQAELDRAAELATQAPYFNPRPITRDGIRELLDGAFHGRRPQ